MQPIHIFNVTPKLPEALEPLRTLAMNLWWTWQPDARKLFRHLDIDLWHRTNHNPVRMLQLCKQARLEEVAREDDFLLEMSKVYQEFQAYMARPDTYGKLRRSYKPGHGPIAYFSAEFGFHESFPNYSGGLGILSGDHCKSASDLDLEFVAITLLYKHGYFRQQINKDGVQESVQLNQNFTHLALTDALDAKGEPCFVSVDLPGRKVRVKVWKLQIGRIPLYLLDTDLAENSDDDRLITAQLYGGDTEMRIKQEIVLGIGGVHALNALGIKPGVYHMNEGHSAFLSLELIRRQVAEKKIDFYAALQIVAAGNVFTTHTPVPAGNDAFPIDLIRRYFGDYPAQAGITFEKLATIGQPGNLASGHFNPHEPFSMTILALRTSRHANGVSKLHGRVSQGLWKEVWVGVPEEEVPITSITNGVHTKTWVAPEFAALYDKYLPEWEEHLMEPEFWRGVIDIPDFDLWDTHQKLKARLVDFVRARARAQRERLAESPERIRQASDLLNPEVLTIGFARRFATYKRATLLFEDSERLHRLLNNPERPVQFVFAGKAHPKDEPGKEFIQKVYKFTQMSEFRDKIVFIEDYDTYVARRLTQGVDLWLNNPRRPLEASGTSGMKLPPNGGLNLSVLDGWWCEGYNGKNGWAIGSELPETPYQIDHDIEDEVDVASLFRIIETQVAPLYYAKPDGKLPLAWIQLMRESIRSVTPVFNTHRMVKEYAERLYEPAAQRCAELIVDGGSHAAELSKWKDEIRHAWPHIKIRDVQLGGHSKGTVMVGEALEVTATVQLGVIKPEHVTVQAYFGETEGTRQSFRNPATADMVLGAKVEAGCYKYSGKIPARESGAYSLSVRVIPTHKNLTQAHELRLIEWAS